MSATSACTLYDEAGHWLGDYDGNGVVVQQAIWLDDLPVGVMAKSSLSYIQPDHLGTPRAVIDPVRDVAIWRWDLKGEAFGNTAPDQDPDHNGTVFVLNLRFPGQWYDVLSGLNQNYFRDYEPGIGRYVQSDPIGLGGGPNTYAYVGGNPSSNVDPLGLASCTYSISGGRLVCIPDNPTKSPVDIPVASGNNGGGAQCKSNPECTDIPNRGPIPQGRWNWNVNGPGSANNKPNGRRLVPDVGTNTHGRSGFLTHSCQNAFGPSVKGPYCSEGCITGSPSGIQQLNELLNSEPNSSVLVTD